MHRIAAKVCSRKPISTILHAGEHTSSPRRRELVVEHSSQHYILWSCIKLQKGGTLLRSYRGMRPGLWDVAEYYA